MTATTPPAPPDGAGGDVVAVGHEIGRIAADGTIVGRAEPYAKVCPSSRQVKRTVGVMAWAILEDTNGATPPDVPNDSTPTTQLPATPEPSIDEAAAGPTWPPTSSTTTNSPG